MRVRIKRDLTFLDLGYTDLAAFGSQLYDVVYHEGDVCALRSTKVVEGSLGVWQADGQDWWFVPVEELEIVGGLQ